MSPPAFTAGLNGRVGLPPVVTLCLDGDWAAASETAAMANASTVNRRMSVSFRETSFYPHLGHEAPVEFRQAGRPQTVDLAQRRGGIRQQRLHVHALAAGRERRQISRSAREHVDRAVVVEPAQMVKRDA